MQIQINTDHNIKGTVEYLTDTEKFEQIVMDALDHFKKYIAKIDIRFTDENAGKVGYQDKRCLIEARINGVRPIVATHHAQNLVLALEGASERLKHSLEHTFGKMRNH